MEAGEADSSGEAAAVDLDSDSDDDVPILVRAEHKRQQSQRAVPPALVKQELQEQSKGDSTRSEPPHHMVTDSVTRTREAVTGLVARTQEEVSAKVPRP
eukprot:3903656-Rhodomonas_salina.1